MDYVWQDGLLTHQSMTYYFHMTLNGTEKVVELPFTAKFIYDESNTPVGCLVNDEMALAFVRNLQGDIIAVVNQEGTALLEYSYDPWGKVTITQNGENLTEQERQIIAVLCPFAYRGYNYDFTTGLYYLQSRYYNPEWGRFLNVDDTNILLSTQGENLGANLFAYCNNNPVNYADYTGYACEELIYNILNYCIVPLACLAYKIEEVGLSSIFENNVVVIPNRDPSGVWEYKFTITKNYNSQSYLNNYYETYDFTFYYGTYSSWRRYLSDLDSSLGFAATWIVQKIAKDVVGRVIGTAMKLEILTNPTAFLIEVGIKIGINKTVGPLKDAYEAKVLFCARSQLYLDDYKKKNPNVNDAFFYALSEVIWMFGNRGTGEINISKPYKGDGRIESLEELL